MDLRCFIAIELSEEVKKNIDIAVSILRAKNADVKWIPSENMHLTLKFLGKTPEELLPEIKENLSGVAASHRPFYIRIYGAGAFPNTRYPRVIWIGIIDSDELKALQEEIEESMEALGFKKEDRPFSPHLTVGRVRSPKGKEMLMEELATFKKMDFGNIEVKNISIIKSELKPTGAQYTIISEVPFGRRSND